MKDVSIIIVTSKRQKLLSVLLNQLSGHFKDSEVIVVINGDKENYQKIKQMFPCHWLEGDFKTPGAARNEGLKVAQRDWVLFLDDDIELPHDFVQKVEKTFMELNRESVVFGGPDQSPNNASFFSKALNLTLSSPMATAHTRLRHTTKHQRVTQGDESNLILCNLWIKRDFIQKNNLQFNENLFRNEENLLISQVLSLGGKVEYFPELFVYHHRKTRVDKLFKAIFSSGIHRIKSCVLSRKLFSPLFLVPGALVVYLLILPMTWHLPHATTPLKIYLTLSLFISLKVGRGLYWPMVFIYQVFINLGYGLGVLTGTLLLPFWSFRLRK